MIYAIIATASRFETSKQIPTFCLDSDVQGFTDKDDFTNESAACEVARTIIDPFGLYDCQITAVEITDSFGNCDCGDILTTFM